MTQKRENGQRYFNKHFGIPRKIPAGRILAHNTVMHTKSMGHGINGFRCWTWPEGNQPAHFAPCSCGWSGLPHWASNEFGEQDCMTDEYFAKRMGFEFEEEAS